MNASTVLHVLWGVFNNPNTPAATKELVKARIETALKSNTSKLSKKISKKLIASV